MPRYKFYWKDGSECEGEGSSPEDAFTHLGYGAGAAEALDYFDPIEETEEKPEHPYPNSERQFFISTKNGQVIQKIARELISIEDMSDCYNPFYEDDDPWIKIFYYEKKTKSFREAVIRGCWHNCHDPLYIAIVDKETGNTLADGYGTDH